MLNVSFKNILRNKSRTVLSLIGIVIGVASILALVSVVDGFYVDITDAIGEVEGIRVLSTSSDPVFSRLDASLGEKLDRFSGVRVAVPIITGPIGTIDDQTYLYGNTRLIGIDFEKQQLARSSGLTGELVSGRNIRPSESGVAVIGKAIEENLSKFVGSSITVNGEKLRIVGVYSTGSEFLDSSIVVSISDARNILSFSGDEVSGFNLELVSPGETANVVDRLNFQFRDEFVAMSASDLSDQFGGILDTFRLLVVAVAGISSIVAGVGIVNTMLMSVIERFSEIGVLKAVGWTSDSVMKMILLESVLIGVIGGLAGIFVGILAGLAIEQFAGLNVVFSPVLVLEVFLYAVFLGVLGGLYPAFVASKMDPVEALQSE